MAAVSRAAQRAGARGARTLDVAGAFPQHVNAEDAAARQHWCHRPSHDE